MDQADSVAANANGFCTIFRSIFAAAATDLAAGAAALAMVRRRVHVIAIAAGRRKFIECHTSLVSFGTHAASHNHVGYKMPPD